VKGWNIEGRRRYKKNEGRKKELRESKELEDDGCT
jgi:hypothetical protein